jgi:hypothetical protein
MGKSMQIKFTAERILVGRSMEVRLDVTGLPGLLREIVTYLRRQRHLETIVIREAGLRAHDPMVWGVIKNQWPHELMRSLSIGVRLAGRRMPKIRDEVTWSVRQGGATTDADMPAIMADWMLAYNGQAVPCYPQLDDAWLQAEDMRLGECLTRFSVRHPSGDRFVFTVRQVNPFPSHPVQVCRITCDSQTALGEVRLVYAGLPATAVFTNCEFRIQGRRCVFDADFAKLSPIQIEWQPLYGESFAALQRDRFQFMRSFWDAHDVVYEDLDKQRRYRTALYEAVKQRSVAAIAMQLRTPKRPEKWPFGVRYQAFPVLGWEPDTGTLILDEPRLPNELCIRFNWELGDDAVIAVRASLQSCRILPSRHIVVVVAGKMISCPRQRRTQIWP